MTVLTITIIVVLALLVNCCIAASDSKRGPLIFQEEFDYLNYNTWTHEITGWRFGNKEFQYYANQTQNSYVRGGVLYIKPTLTADRFGEAFLYNGTLDLNPEGCNINNDNGCIIVAGDEIIPPVQSARIISRDSFAFNFGTIEIRARMPKGDWLWPAIWMFPRDSVYGNWPGSGELDIVEVRGNEQFNCGNDPLGRQLTGSTLHWGPDPGQNRYPTTTWGKVNRTNDYSSDFHIYRVEWLTTGIQFYVDEELIGQVSPPAGGFWEMGGFQGNNLWQNGTNMAPFDQPFFFVVNVAVGGSFFTDDPNCANSPYAKPWKDSDDIQMKPFWESKNEWLPTWNADTEDNAMQVDYIRVYALG